MHSFTPPSLWKLFQDQSASQAEVGERGGDQTLPDSLRTRAAPKQSPSMIRGRQRGSWVITTYRLSLGTAQPHLDKVSDNTQGWCKSNCTITVGSHVLPLCSHLAGFMN